MMITLCTVGMKSLKCYRAILVLNSFFLGIEVQPNIRLQTMKSFCGMAKEARIMVMYVRRL
jgi:hypothetical protein